MVTLRRALAAGWVVLLATLGALAATVGLGLPGWGVALVCGVVLTAAVVRSGVPLLGPADLVTVTRAALACALAGWVADALLHSEPAPGVLVGLAVVALSLDAVDGQVARRTGTASAVGARMDGEADAFLLLVLSVHVAGTTAWWAVAIGLARYGFGIAGWALPWLRAPLPFRYWRKVVTAVQGIALVVAAAGVVPLAITYAALAVAIALLAESFGRDVVWLWRWRGAVGVVSPSAFAVLAGHEDTRS